jgi:hypothetical protein
MGAAVDISLIGAWVENDALHAGDRNTLRAEFRGITGSGTRANRYGHASGLSGTPPPHLQGTGNRLEIVGDSATFARSNRLIDPPPTAEFFSRRAPAMRPDPGR